MNAILKKLLILNAIWVRGFLAVIISGGVSALIAWLLGQRAEELWRTVIAAVGPSVAAYLMKSPVPKLPKELYDEVKVELQNDTETFTKGDIK